MILRPVRPASPIGPPTTNLPVGLTSTRVADESSVSWASSFSTVASTCLRMSGSSVFSRSIVGRVLGGDDHGVQADRNVVLIVDGDLRLAVRPQVGQGAVLADLGQLPRQPVGQRDRQRHQLRGVVDRVAEHQALVTGALRVQRVRGALNARLVRGVDALCDIGRLTADADVDAACQPVKALVRVVVADVEDALANGVGDVGEGLLGRRRHLTDNVHLPGGHQRLDGDT